VDIEDFEFGQKLVGLLRRHLARMLLTSQPHLDIAEILQQFPDSYKDGKEQDVTEAVRFLFDKLGSYHQSLIRDVFSGELMLKLQCARCGVVKQTPETFSESILTVPTEEEVLRSGCLPTMQSLLNGALQVEQMTEDACPFCENCQMKSPAMKWSEILSPPAHFCAHLGRETYDERTGTIVKVKTPVRIDQFLQIGQFSYELYMVIIHTGKDASSGHYYGIGCRSESMGAKQYMMMDDSQIKPADPAALSVLSGTSPDKADDNPQVVFYRCLQALPTPGEVPFSHAAVEDVRREDLMAM
jgi:ubiquitin carboxyl-terminal hydrolase 35/38